MKSSKQQHLWWLWILTFFCPILAIRKIALSYPNLRQKLWVRAGLCLWLTGWSFLLAYLFCSPLIPLSSTPHSNNQSQISSLEESPTKTDLPQTIDDQTSIPDSAAAQDTNDSENSSSSQANTVPIDNQSSAPVSSAPDTPTQPTDTGIMAGITMQEAENVPYDRSAYQPNWSVGGGCDIRSRILSTTSLIAVSYGSNGCTVKNGSWNDPYTGTVLTGNPYQGDGTANDLDIDHIIPLKYVNSHGGYYWDAATKRAYGASLAAMNNGVYLAVSASESRKKSDQGPASYYPPNPSYRCEYARKWRDIARIYTISLAPADYQLVESIIISCGGN